MRKVLDRDYNRDGALDLAVVSTSTGAVSMLFGDGQGRFSAPLAVTVPSSPIALATADFNADGKMDVATASSTSNSVSVLLGNGLGGLSAPQSFAVGTGPGWLASKDVNGDSIVDLVTINTTAGSASVLLGDGTGKFLAARTSVIFESRPSYVLIADTTQDGKQDLVVCRAGNGFDPSSVNIYSGDGTGTFTSTLLSAIGDTPAAVDAADLDEDGNLDLAVIDSKSSQLRILWGAANGRQGPVKHVPTGLLPKALARSDMNGDGQPDLVTVNAGSLDLSVLIKRSGFLFEPAVTVPAAGALDGIAIGDFNSDGKADVVMSRAAGGGLGLFLGSGDGRLSPPLSFVPGTTPGPIASGDLNKDGTSDLVSSGQGLTVYLGSAQDTFSAPQLYEPAAARSNALVLVDADRDGNLDVLSLLPSSLRFSQGDGSGRLSAARSFPTQRPAADFLARDLNRDGNIDVALLGTTSPRTIEVQLGDGKGGFRSHFLAVLINPASALLDAADFNLDGFLDLVVIGSDILGQSSLLINDGTGRFLQSPGMQVGNKPGAVLAADWNGDGRPDLAVANGSLGSVSVVENESR